MPSYPAELKARALTLLAQGASIRSTARECGVGVATIVRWRNEALVRREDGRRYNGRRPTAPRLSLEELEIVRGYVIEANRTRLAGSVPAGIRRALREGVLDPQRADQILARDRTGKPLLTREQLRMLQVPEPIVRSLRTARDAAWTYASADGALPLLLNEDAPIPPGAVWTLDDATINFPAVVRIERPGDPCFDRYGVMVGRFQVILVVDHRTYYIPAFIHTARPRQQYRAEDVMAALGAACRAHGLPRVVILERGISAATSITAACQALEITIRRARTPHTKAAEWVFNKLWTLLSHERGQLGRFAGDDDRWERLYQRARRGEIDPRQYFLPLEDVLAALREAITAHNTGFVESRRFGRWCPEAWWQRQASDHLRPFPADRAWALAPTRLGPVKVHGTMVRSTIRLMETHSTLVSYAAPELADWHGARVCIWTDPYIDGMPGDIVLAEPFQGKEPGTWICRAEQIDAWARYTRRRLLLGAEPDVGAAVISRCRHAMRRRAIAIAAKGRVVLDEETVRDGRGNAAHIVRTPAPQARQSQPAPDPGPRRTTASTQPRPDHALRVIYDDPRLREAYEELFGPLTLDTL